MMAISKDPLIAELPISLDPEKSIDDLINLLGFPKKIFKELLKSLLIEELLDRLRPSNNEIRQLRMIPNHLEILKKRIEQSTRVEWPLKIIELYWQRIRIDDNQIKREPIPLYKKLQLLATKEQKCEICQKIPPEITLQIDHIYAASKGGPSELWNLRFLCSECNLIKSNHLDWRLYAVNR